MATFVDLGTMGVMNIDPNREVVVCVGANEQGLPVFHLDDFSLDAHEAVNLYEWLGEWLRGAGLVE